MWKRHNYYYHIGSIFDRTEANKIINDALATKAPQSGLLTLEGTQERVRESTIYWLNTRNPDNKWIFERLWKPIESWNKDFGFDISQESLTFCQVSRYVVGQRYDWHMDIGQGESSLRKLSMVVALNDPQEFEGGGLEIFYGGDRNPILNLNPGEGVIFPSYIMHRARPITKGSRWSLAIWVKGNNPFK